MAAKMHIVATRCRARDANPRGSLAVNFDLTGRVAIVTGGSRGLGRAIVRAFAEHGASVVIASRDAERCETAAAEVRSAGGEAIAVPTHVGRHDQLGALVERTVGHFGSLDVLVNCAANPLGGPLADMTPEALEASFRTNVTAPVLLGAAALPHLEASEHASVINVITVGAFAGAPYLGAYTAGKAALWNLTRTMAKEWGPMGVRVNAIAPGPFDTDMMAPSLGIPEFRQQIIDATIQQRIAEPDEVAGAAVLLASDAGSYMTGSCITVDGGTTA